MKDIDQIRRDNMVILQNEVGGPTAAAARIGWDQSQWSNLKNGAADSKTGRPRGMHKNTARKIELAFSREEFWLDTDHSAESNVEPAPDIVMSKLLPISGEIQGGDNGYLDIQQFPAGYAEGCVAHPVRSPNCYALRVRGDSMHPRIKHREIIVIDPDHDLKEGDEIVIHLRDGRQMVKVFLYERDGEVSLGSINDKHPIINVRQEEIKEMHFVAAILPIGSVCKKV